MITPEGREKKKIRAYLDSIGAWHQVVHMTGYGQGGAPDILFCYRGRFGSIEVKREGKEPTPRQELRLDQIAKAGGIATWGTANRVITILQAAYLFPNATSASE